MTKSTGWSPPFSKTGLLWAIITQLVTVVVSAMRDPARRKRAERLEGSEVRKQERGLGTRKRLSRATVGGFQEWGRAQLLDGSGNARFPMAGSEVE